MQDNPSLWWLVLNEMNRDHDRFMEKLLGNDNKPKPAKFPEQIEREIKRGTIKRIHPLHLLMNLLSMTIFPFIARPMITRNLHLSELQFLKTMEERKKEIPRFIIDSIKK